MRLLANLLGLGFTGGVWLWLLNQPLDPTVSIFLAIAGAFGVLPLVWVGRRLLDAQPTIEHALWVTTFVHYSVFALLGAAIVEATQVGMTTPGWAIPLPPEVGLALMIVSGVLVLLAMANLALRGLGAPFAIALSRELAMDWLYAWTRNPMVLSALAFLIAVGLWLRSTERFVSRSILRPSNPASSCSIWALTPSMSAWGRSILLITGIMVRPCSRAK